MAYTTINDPSKHFQTVIWTGDGNDDRSITFDGNSDMQPDMVWTKRRPTASSHGLRDSTRGAVVELFPDDTAMDTSVADRFQAFESDGFQVGTNADINGTSNNTYVAWAWKANGGTTSSNGNGDITSTVQVSSTAGFSIVTYTATATAGDTVGHGLSSQPEMIMVKKRAGGDAYGWGVWHTGLSNNNGTKQLILDTSAAEATQDMFNDAIFPSSSATVFATGQNNHTNFPSGATYVAYCFNSVQGYSKFGKYTGNGSPSSADFDGPFVYTGFKPAWIMCKRSSASDGSWGIIDNKRDTTNPIQIALFANTSGADDTDKKVDFLSNGFKLRNSRDDFNTDGVNYVYMAFAEQPFVTSSGVPATAR